MRYKPEDEKWKTIVSMLRAGETYDEIRNTQHVGYGTIMRIRKEENIEPQISGPRPKPVYKVTSGALASWSKCPCCDRLLRVRVQDGEDSISIQWMPRAGEKSGVGLFPVCRDCAPWVASCWGNLPAFRFLMKQYEVYPPIVETGVEYFASGELYLSDRTGNMEDAYCVHDGPTLHRFDSSGRPLSSAEMLTLKDSV